MPADQSGDEGTERAVSGECQVCGETFDEETVDEYNRAVAYHIKDNHSDEPIDKPLVIPDESDSDDE